jgi:TPR repeat protein/cellulose synthase/poly-beta-1,6-N-acetylglucosamine synthase-like glycosyltransferase
VLVFGINFTVWGAIGFLRVVDGTLDKFRHLPRNAGSAAHRVLRADRVVQATANGGLTGPALASGGGRILTVADLAVLMAAHNEEVVIDDSLAAITALVPPENVHVVSDASTDGTVALALRHGVNVIETATNVGKAGALDEGIRTFGLVERFSVVLLLDADTRLDPGYFQAALPLFDDPDIVAVAGCAHSNWHTPGLSFIGRLVTAHRSRIYALTQRLLKYGQTWRRTNATHIVPGFASIYRTTVLPNITINPRGLVIEDFNMTFEVYRKNLGRVGFTPSARAFTQDPDTVRDYIKQTKRWALGLWQTVRRHRLHPDLLSAMLCLLLLELLSASLVFLVLPVIVIVLAVPDLLPLVLHWHVAYAIHSAIASHVSLRAIYLGVLGPDLVLTLLVAAVERRPRYLLYGLFFVFLRTIDAAIAVYTLPRAWQEKSTGRWVSPARRDPAGGTTVHPVARLRDAQTEVMSADADLVDTEQAIAAETKLAEAGDVEAQFRLGGLFAIVLDPPDLAKGRIWWTRAAEAGNAEAQNHLGVLLVTELDPPELDQARVWWTRAAEAGNAEAQFNLGALLAIELNPPELEEARMWWTRAAEAGHTGAQNNLAVLLTDLLEPAQADELAEACAWYTKAAASGDIRAQYGLGRLLATALEPPELAAARTWWTQAAEAGHVESQYGLARLLADLLDPPELDEARAWYTKAANAGRIEAQYDLGVLLAERIRPPDLDQARAWYTRAAEAGHSGARFKLGRLMAAQLAKPQLAETRFGASNEAGPAGPWDPR